MSNYPTVDPERAAAAFRALGNPRRLRLFLRLMDCCAPGATCCDTGEVEAEKRCVGEIGDELEVAPSTVSHHLKELRRAGLIHMERKGRNIECWVEPGTLRGLAAFFVPEQEGTR